MCYNLSQQERELKHERTKCKRHKWDCERQKRLPAHLKYMAAAIPVYNGTHRKDISLTVSQGRYTTVDSCRTAYDSCQEPEWQG